MLCKHLQSINLWSNFQSVQMHVQLNIMFLQKMILNLIYFCYNSNRWPQVLWSCKGHRCYHHIFLLQTQKIGWEKEKPTKPYCLKGLCAGDFICCKHWLPNKHSNNSFLLQQKRNLKYPLLQKVLWDSLSQECQGVPVILHINFYVRALLFMLWQSVDSFILALISAVWVSPE